MCVIHACLMLLPLVTHRNSRYFSLHRSACFLLAAGFAPQSFALTQQQPLSRQRGVIARGNSFVPNQQRQFYSGSRTGKHEQGSMKHITHAASTGSSPGAAPTSAGSLAQYATELKGEWAFGPADEALKRLVPDLQRSHHKGQLGRVGVFGGSKDYTGAPFFASISALRTGADLAYVLTAEEAAPALKIYSPELMVSPIYSGSELKGSGQELLDPAKPLLRKLHSLVLGPGLGRNELMRYGLISIVRYVRERNIPISVDADALAMVASAGQYSGQEPRLDMEMADDADEGIQDKEVATLGLGDYLRAVLTPNANEFRLLFEGLLGVSPPFEDQQDEKDDGSASIKAVGRLARALGVTVVLKGPVDVISNGKQTITCAVPGGLKRCGGIGDVLSGAMGTMLAWVSIQGFEGEEADEMQLWAAWWACAVTRHASRKAYEIHGRGMSATHVMDQMGRVLEEVAPSPPVED